MYFHYFQDNKKGGYTMMAHPPVGVNMVCVFFSRVG